MQVILQRNVATLGAVGDVVRVKSGYARNFLIPRGLALIANDRNVKVLEHMKRVVEHKRVKAKAEAQTAAEAIEKVTLTFVRKASTDDSKLFGSVTSKDIEEALAAQGVSVSRKQIILHQPLRSSGDHVVDIKLPPEVTAHLKVRVDIEVTKPAVAEGEARPKRGAKRPRKAAAAAEDAPAEGAEPVAETSEE